MFIWKDLVKWPYNFEKNMVGKTWYYILHRNIGMKINTLAQFFRRAATPAKYEAAF